MTNVLIVEDDPMVALINRRYLEQIGDIKVFGPVMYESDIWSILEKENIDLIIMDVFLPKEDGLEILKSLRDKKCLIDIIMITAANSVEELKKAFACGVVDYLVKPFEFKRFEEAIKKYKVKKNILCKGQPLNQNDVDTILSTKVIYDADINLPKGLNIPSKHYIISSIKGIIRWNNV